jgi:trk system potassium uptake protein TrkA
VRIIIVGGGRIGAELARNLARREGNEVVVIEIDESRCRELAEKLDALVLQGDGTQPEMLRKANIGEAHALVAVTNSDAINAVIVMLGHRANVDKIVVKLDEPGLHAACQEVGATDIIAPSLASAAQIAAVLYGFHRLDFTLITRSGLRLVELEAGAAVGRKLSELDLPDGVLVVAIVRGDESLLARGKTKIESDDGLLLLVENDDVLAQAKAVIDAG